MKRYPDNSRKYIWKIGKLKEDNFNYRDSDIPKIDSSKLCFFNGYGGFNGDGEYTIILKKMVGNMAPG